MKFSSFYLLRSYVQVNQLLIYVYIPKQVCVRYCDYIPQYAENC